jgi:hypothetical protein
LPAATGGPDVVQPEVEVEEFVDAEAEFGATGAKALEWGAVFAANDVELPIDPTIADELGFGVARPLELEAVLVWIGGVLAASAEDVVEGWLGVATKDGAGVVVTAAGIATGLFGTASGAEPVPVLGTVPFADGEATGELIGEDFALLASLMSRKPTGEVTVLSIGSRVGWAVVDGAAASDASA